jgi:hypothetical protein
MNQICLSIQELELDNITADKITELLKQRHKNDVCVPQCKTGPTYGNRWMYIMDFWVMPRSWAKPAIRAYEIKVNRSDFLNDKKWEEYLLYCNEFYFVCPRDLIYPQELPQGVGLMYVSKNCKRLTTKIKAVNRSVEIPEEIFRYILMARANIVRDQMTNREYWENWLKQKEDDFDLGHRVSKKIRSEIKKKICSVDEENRGLKRENANLLGVKEFCEKLNIDINGYRYESRLEDLKKGLPKEFIEAVDIIMNGLNTIKSFIENGEKL